MYPPKSPQAHPLETPLELGDLVLIVLLCRCSPYMCRYVFPRTIWRVPYLSSNQKLLQMQEYTHVLMQLRTGSSPYVPYDAPVPQACKQVLNACPIETMNIIVLLLPLGQCLSTDKWPCHMEAPLVCTIHGANLIIHIMSHHPFGPLAIPNENIRRCPRGQRTNPNDVAQAVNGNRNFVCAPGVFRIKQDIAKDASYGRLGPKRGRKCYITPAFSGVPNKGGQNQNSKPPLRVTMMPLGAPSISKYGSLVRPDAQIVALCAHCA